MGDWERCVRIEALEALGAVVQALAQDRRVDLEGRSVATSRRRPRRAACSGPCWRAARNWSRPRRHGFRRPVFRVARAGRPQRRLTAGCSQQSGSRCRTGRTSSRPPRRWTAVRSPPARAAGRTSSCPTRPLRTGAPRVDGLALPRRPTPLQLPRDPAAKPWRRSRAAEQIPPVARNVEEDRYRPVRLGPWWGHGTHPCGHHPLVGGGEVVDAEEEAHPARDLVATTRSWPGSARASRTPVAAPGGRTTTHRLDPAVGDRR